jgi:hypothetical protein
LCQGGDGNYQVPSKNEPSQIVFKSGGFGTCSTWRARAEPPKDIAELQKAAAALVKAVKGLGH